MNNNAITLRIKDVSIEMSSILSLFFLLSIVVVHINDSRALLLVRYGVAVFCAIYGLLVRAWLDSRVVILSVITLLTGFCNYLVVGNMTFMGLIYCMLSPFIALVLLDVRIQPEFILVSFYITVLIVLYSFATKGLSSPVFFDVSNNYVSVFLLNSITVYYSLRERERCNINIIHMCVCWVVCILSQGRGGILCATVMIVALFYIKNRNSRTDRATRIIACGFTVVILGMLGYVNDIFNSILNSSFLEHFQRNGISSNGRSAIWMSYLKCSLSSLKNFVFGTKTSSVPILTQFKGDMHNSFLAMHAFNGIVFLLYILVCCIISGINAIRSRRMVFIICFTTFCLRGMTDKTFWGSSAGVPVLFFFLLEGIEYNMDSR